MVISHGARVWRSTILVLTLAIAALAGLAGLVPRKAAAPEPRYLLALGDSITRGIQPDPSGLRVATPRGYADLVFAAERQRIPGLRLVNLACPGETTTTMTRGGRCRYRAGSQLREAESFLRANRSRVVLVTVAIGANDVLRCGSTEGVDASCASRRLGALGRSMPIVTRRLRAAAGRTKLVGLTYHNPLLGLYLREPAGRALARASVPFAAGFNGLLADSYRRDRIRVADVAGAFRSNELARSEPLPGVGPVPVAVARVCRLTWACALPPRGPDIHPNDAGHRVIADGVRRARR